MAIRTDVISAKAQIARGIEVTDMTDEDGVTEALRQAHVVYRQWQADVRAVTTEREPHPNQYFAEGVGATEFEALFTKTDNGGLTISVGQEQAVDSYNEWFTCVAELPESEARLLVTWLVKQYG